MKSIMTSRGWLATAVLCLVLAASLELCSGLNCYQCAYKDPNCPLYGAPADSHKTDCSKACKNGTAAAVACRKIELHEDDEYLGARDIVVRQCACTKETSDRIEGGCLTVHGPNGENFKVKSCECDSDNCNAGAGMVPSVALLLLAPCVWALGASAALLGY